MGVKTLQKKATVPSKKRIIILDITSPSKN